jgi:hypothetical protein
MRMLRYILPTVVAGLLCPFSFQLVAQEAPPHPRYAADRERILYEAARSQDTLIINLRNVPQVVDTVELICHPPCRPLIVSIGRDAEVLAATLARGRIQLAAYLDRHNLEPMSYYFSYFYPQIPEGSVHYSGSGKLYVSNEVADSLANAVAAIIAEIRSANAAILVDLLVDVVPLGAVIRAWALDGPVHETFSNNPIIGLPLGLYDVRISVGDRVRWRGGVNLWDGGRTLYCRFDYPEPGRGGCTQRR